MCNQWRNKNDSELSLDEWKNTLEQLKENNIREVVFSGGEPFLRGDLLEIISYAKTLKFKVGIITNGYLLERVILDKLIDLGVDSISISLDGDEEQFDRIRGVKGAYKKVINSCKMLSEYRKKKALSVYLCFTLMKDTLSSYRSVLRISQHFNIPLVVNLFDYTPYFFKSLEKEQFWIKGNYDLERLKELQRLFIEKKKENPKSIYHTYSEIKYFRSYFKDPLQKNIPCVVSQQRLGIDSCGNVFGGCWSMGSFGNLRERSLKEIMNSDKYKLAHKNMFFKNCPGCSCGYITNLRYNISFLLKEAIFSLPILRRKYF
ncbi:MAG: radical SAM protein [Candidatus Omnitrophica bacterium]|nr:radical SAM protein [Candidatus Omnitrophota bacterium]MCM8832744.1 radical SAM protein [Candidatus Omnitrophota bacterium]